MARSESRLKTCMITQQTREELWDRYPADVHELLRQANEAETTDDLRDAAWALGGVLVQRLDGLSEDDVPSAHAIIHDKDTHQVWDEVRRELVECVKERHIHLVVGFQGKGHTITEIADAVKFPPAHIEKAKASRYALDNMWSYLIHAKDPGKFQYSPLQVATVRGVTYSGIHAERASAWKKGAAVKIAKEAKTPEAIDDLIARCLTGEVRKPQILLDDQLFEVYARNRRVVDEAIDTFGQRRAMKAAQKLRNGEFTTRVLYVTGPPGAGKSRFSRLLVDAVIDMASNAGHRWEMYKGASSNPLDGYAGEEVILLDDLRPGAMLADDWLHLLDAESADAASARYKNKENIAPRLVIVTAFADPLDFFFFTKSRGGIDEAMDQFMRRLAMVCRMLSAEEIPGVYRFALDLIGKREPYTRTINTARGTSSSVNLTYGMVQRARTNSEDVLIDYLLDDLMRVSSDIQWSQPALIESPADGLDIIDAEVIEVEDARQREVAAERQRERQRDEMIGGAVRQGLDATQAQEYADTWDHAWPAHSEKLFF